MSFSLVLYEKAERCSHVCSVCSAIDSHFYDHLVNAGWTVQRAPRHMGILREKDAEQAGGQHNRTYLVRHLVENDVLSLVVWPVNLKIAKRGISEQLPAGDYGLYVNIPAVGFELAG